MEKFKQFLYKTKDFLDKYWKVIIICVGAILLMGQCSSCNRDNRVQRINNEKTHIIDSLTKVTDTLVIKVNHLQDRLGVAQSNYDKIANIAQGNKEEAISQISAKDTEINKLTTKINELTKTINNLTSKVNSLTKENDALRKLNKQ